MKKFSFVYITFPTRKEAERVAKVLLFKRLSVCCNVFKIDSFYWWKKKIERAGEYGMIVKTRRALVEKVIKTVKKIHSYSIPCIVSFEIQKGNKEFLDWIEKETQNRSKT